MTTKSLNPIAIEKDVQFGILKQYRYSAQGYSAFFAPGDLLVNRYPSKIDDFAGNAPMSKALDAVGVKRNMQKFLRAFYENDATPGGLVSVKDGVNLSEDQKKQLIDQWQAALRGVDNAYSWMYSPNELNVTKFDTTPPEHQDVLSEDQRRDICAAFRVPMALVSAGGVSDPLSAGGTMDSTRAMFYEDFVIPECDEIASEINDKWMSFLSPYRALYF